MSATKKTLARYIEAYASAKASGNVDLQTFAAHQLSSFIQSVEITGEPTTAVDSIEPATDDSGSD